MAINSIDRDTDELNATVVLSKNLHTQEDLLDGNFDDDIGKTVELDDDQDENATVFLDKTLDENEDLEGLLETNEELCPDVAKRFRFICYFAAGGIGQLCKAKDMTFNRVVAIKRLNEKYRSNPYVVKSFLRECRLNAQLDHPSIVPVYAMGKSEDGQWEVVMKLINGTSLAEFIKTSRDTYAGKKVNNRQERQALISRLEYFLKICEVIDYCHNRRIVHGDLKPSNIMMGQYGEVYVMDWGCAQNEGAIPEHLSGTPNYLPPEFLKNKKSKITTTIDIYALGVLLFEMVTLQRGKTGSTTLGSGTQTHYNIMELEKWHYQPKLKVTKAMKAIILKAVNPNPAKRYQKINDLARDVRSFIYDEEVSAAPDGILRKCFRFMYRNRLKTIIIFFVIFILICLLMFDAIMQHQKNDIEQERHRVTMKRLKLQSYTEGLRVAQERRFLLVQTQILLFADDLVENLRHHNTDNSKFYNNEDYKSPETSPIGMVRTSLYPSLVNLTQMARFPASSYHPIQEKLPTAEEFVRSCQKVIRVNFNVHGISIMKHDHRSLLEPEYHIQRLFVYWLDGTNYSYPGMFDNPNSPAYPFRWSNYDKTNLKKEVSWSKAYVSNTGIHHVVCRFPMFDSEDNFVGVACLEIRLERLLLPLRMAAIDSEHNVYYINREGNVFSVNENKIVLPDENGLFVDGTLKADILKISDRLRENGFQQFTTELNNKEYFVSGAYFPIVDGLFFQLLETKMMEGHDCERDMRVLEKVAPAGK